VKTRIQNQKPLPDGSYPYRGMLDCYRKSVASGGFASLYRGLPAVIIGITPEKAIKLAVNDLMCEQFRLHLGVSNLPIPYLVVSGAVAGTCQVIATNPMEITKLRMQLSSKPMSEVVSEMGIRGLYKGVAATLSRDVPFSMIYFSMYGFLKQKCNDEKGYAPTWKVFLAGITSGMTAAVCSTPADVVKTRYQAVAEPGTEPYKGVIDTARRTYQEGGAKAFLRGAGPRAIVIGPLFGIALAVYELQKRFLDSIFADSRR